MNIKVFFAVAACKSTRFMLRILKRGGTALPGKVALRLCPDLLRHLSRGVDVVAVTGTNGKTTSSRIIEQVFVNAGVSYFSNKSGSNLMQGITTEFAINATLSGKPKNKYAVIECDEAASKKVFEYMNPKVILVTNVFRDQLDRYGEVTHTLENIKVGVKNAPDAVVCLNADCSLTVSVADSIPNRIVYFGVDTEIYKDRVQELSDATHCIHCRTEYEYSYVTYGHLGGFYCPSCGYKRPDAQIAATRVISQDADSSSVKLRAFNETRNLTINLPGGYNIYNAVGSIAAATQMGFQLDTAVEAAGSFECGFGRMEKFELDGVPVRMILVKNPAGCNQVLNFLNNIDGDALFVVCLNDKIADGTDVSWIWDVDFEKLSNLGDHLSGVLVSGIRAEDMAVRIKYAAIGEGKTTVIKDYSELIKTITSQDKPVFIMPTYTAMLDLREQISKDYDYKEFWQ